MRLTIVGATGGIGRHLLEQAIAAGHDVTVVVRNPSRLATGGVRVVTADLAGADPTALEGAVDRADAVLSGLGPRSLSDAGVASVGTGSIIRAMQATSTRRIVVVRPRRRSGRCRRRRGRSRRGTIPATDSSCVTCSRR